MEVRSLIFVYWCSPSSKQTIEPQKSKARGKEKRDGQPPPHTEKKKLQRSKLEGGGRDGRGARASPSQVERAQGESSTETSSVADGGYTNGRAVMPLFR
eukprot:2297517-Rhodomonas_salina.3